MRFLSLVFCGIAVWSHAAPPPEEAKKTSGKEKVRAFIGVIATGDAKDPVLGQPVKVIPLRLTRGATYLIEAKSKDFDPIIRIENSKGVEIARNDNADKGSTDAVLDFMVPSDDEYHVFVSMVDGRVGGYKLTVYPKSKPGEPGATLIEGKLETGKPGEHSIKTKKYKRYVIDLLFLGEVNGAKLTGEASGSKFNKENAAFGGDPRRARIEFLSEEEGTLTVRVCGESTAKYLLNVRESRSPDVFVTLTEKAFKLEDELSDEDPRDRKRKQCYCRTIRVNLQAGKFYEIGMTAEFDTYLRLENKKNEEVAADDDSGEGNNSLIRYECKVEGVYSIRATSFQPETGPFTLTINEAKKKK